MFSPPRSRHPPVALGSIAAVSRAKSGCSSRTGSTPPQPPKLSPKAHNNANCHSCIHTGICVRVCVCVTMSWSPWPSCKQVPRYIPNRSLAICSLAASAVIAFQSTMARSGKTRNSLDDLHSQGACKGCLGVPPYVILGSLDANGCKRIKPLNSPQACESTF